MALIDALRPSDDPRPQDVSAYCNWQVFVLIKHGNLRLSGAAH
jgi:hypothetical protein